MIELPEGSSVEATEKVATEMVKKLSTIPGVARVIPQSSPQMDRVTFGNITLLLKPQEEREDIIAMGQRVRMALREWAYTRPRVTFPNALGGRDTFAPIRAQLLGADINTLVPLAREISAAMMREPALADIKANLNLNNPELQVNIDRQLASDLGVRVSDVAGAVRLLMSGEDEISTFKEGSEQYPVTMRLLPGQRDDPNALSRLLVPSAKQGLIRLDSIAKLERGLGPSRIDRFNRQFAVGLYGNIAPGHSLAEGAEAVQRIVNETGLPKGYQMSFSGQVKILEETTANMLLAFALASVFMYMVLAAQFESLVHPFIILLTLPLSIPFALLSLIATGRTLNRVRLRPILMTTLSIVAGLIPTAIGVGAGASQRSAIAVTIIGGQTLCLLLTLLVVPIGYAYVEEIRGYMARRKQAKQAVVASPAMGD
jgi:HAE1 family hydrophobic/amphiphilic exporter-1